MGAIHLVRGLLCTTAVGLLYMPLPGMAQVIPDSTLGTETSVVTPLDANMDRIDGGALRNSLLFHSFEAFSIPEGHGVYFANPAFVNTIFSRVTGVDPSLLFGTLGVLGDAGLMFINPNGILFGPNARLDLRGAFTATTATGVVFPGGEVFSALTPEAAPLLTVNVQAPVGLIFEGSEQGDISNEGILSIEGDFTLAAQNLHLQGQIHSNGNLILHAQENLAVQDNSSNPFIATAGDELLLQGNEAIDISTINHPDSGFFSGRDLILRSSDNVGGDAHYFSGGDFRVEELDGSLGNLFSPYDPIIRASGDVSFNSYEGASLHILAGGSVTVGGDIRITGTDITGNAINPVDNPDLTTITSEGGQPIVVNREPVIVDGEVQIIDGEVQYTEGVPLIIDGTEQPTLDIRAGTLAYDSLGGIGSTDGIVGESGEYDPAPEGSAADAGTSANIIVNGTITNPSGLVFLTNQYEPDLKLSEGDITTGGIRTTQVDRAFDSTTGETVLQVDAGNVVINARGSIAIQDEISTYAEARSGEVFPALTNNARLEARGGDIILTAGQNITTQAINSGSGVYLQSTNQIANDIFASQATSTSIGGAILLDSGGNISIGDLGASAISLVNANASESSFESAAFGGRIGPLNAVSSSGIVAISQKVLKAHEL